MFRMATCGMKFLGRMFARSLGEAHRECRQLGACYDHGPLVLAQTPEEFNNVGKRASVDHVLAARYYPNKEMVCFNRQLWVLYRSYGIFAS